MFQITQILNVPKVRLLTMETSYLFLGPRANQNHPEITGGIIVLFENFISYCDKNSIDYIVIDTNKGNYANKLLAYIQIVYLLCIKTHKVEKVSLHGTANDYLLIAPLALLISKMFGRSFSLRKFAGNFIEIYERYSPLKKYIIKKTLEKSSYNFFETKYLVEYFKKYNENTFWFPNVRENQSSVKVDSYKKKFIYLGAITKEKGIDVLCKTSNMISSEYIIDLYGSLSFDYNVDFFADYHVSYKGKLNQKDVIDTLLQYDVLVLPSFREGYPGVVIEALSVGLPIVASNLQGISEMVDEKSAKLFEVGDAIELKEALESFDEINYKKMSESALKQFEQFDYVIQTKKYFDKIESK